MKIVTFTGKVFSVNVTDREGPDGKPSKMAAMKFTISEKVRDREGNWNYETTWCEATAFGRQAENWANYRRGDVIEGTGRFEIRTYVNSAGDTAFTMRVLGIEGLSPSLQWTPRPQHDDDPAKPEPAKPKSAKAKIVNELGFGNDDDDF